MHDSKNSESSDEKERRGEGRFREWWQVADWFAQKISRTARSEVTKLPTSAQDGPSGRLIARSPSEG